MSVCTNIRVAAIDGHTNISPPTQHLCISSRPKIKSLFVGKNVANELSSSTKIQHVELTATSSDGSTTRQKDVVSLDISPQSDHKKGPTQPKVNFLHHIIAIKQDEVFCFVCNHFAVKDNVCEDILLRGYSDWKHISNIATKHENSKVHKLSLAKFQGWLQTKQSGPVTVQINDQVTRTSLIREVLFCTRQNIGLWGHRDSLDKVNYKYSEGCAEAQHFNNMGNFQELINLLCLENKSFSSKLNIMPQNAKYTSNIIQNYMMQAATSVIAQDIVREIKSESTVYSLNVDEARDEWLTEQISICVRYLHNSEIKEGFLGFMELDQLNAHALANRINFFLNSVGLDLTNCVSQPFDGASVTSGALNGVQALIRHLTNNYCTYVHGHAHRLNLILVDISKSVYFVGEIIGLLEAIYAFQYSSILRYNVFMKSQVSCGLNKLNVPQHSDTRARRRKKFDKLYNEAMKIAESCNILTPSPSVMSKSTDFIVSSSSRKQTINVRLADYFVTESVGKGKVCTCTQDGITDKC
ncbi:hypothetical protein PR048_001822 [Dryococelus australis]|uniref:DUF4371 domain-containing protein n=1 Tax=Dryococelus australis TaxID=614101 RepID=A0ABQ9IIF7_9NEOP|nr:hypothetical protein PR048_001822 [Dryococelus australis]